jgi:hypothetical protein
MEDQNRACFEGKLIKNPSEIIYYACSFLRYCPSLQLGVDKNDILSGARALQAQASLIQSSSPARLTLQIEDSSSMAAVQGGTQQTPPS